MTCKGTWCSEIGPPVGPSLHALQSSQHCKVQSARPRLRTSEMSETSVSRETLPPILWSKMSRESEHRRFLCIGELVCSRSPTGKQTKNIRVTRYKLHFIASCHSPIRGGLQQPLQLRRVRCSMPEAEVQRPTPQFKVSARSSQHSRRATAKNPSSLTPLVVAVDV